MPANKRILIIGLDGGTFNIILPMMKDGRLPVIGGLIEQGVHGPLRSTVPPVTPPAWASFMTGKNPGKHGVFGFYAGRRSGYETELVTGRSIQGPKFWDYPEGIKTGLVDIPMTYPPEPLTGWMISGWPIPSDDSVFTHPPEFQTELIREIGEYMIDKTLAGLSRNGVDDALQHLYRYTRMRQDAALYLLRQKGPFDLFTVVFRGTDYIQHAAFKYLDPKYGRAHPETARKYGDIIFRFYEYMDRVIAELRQSMGEDAVTLIMSDHGAGPMKKRFYFNRWLRREGFLSVKKGWAKRLEIHRKPLGKLLDRMGGAALARRIPDRLSRIMTPYPWLVIKPPTDRIDWLKTRAFSNLVWTDGVVRINLAGREPRGSVDPAEYEEIRESLIQKLLTLEDPETGERIIEKVHKREEIYHGPCLEAAPDLFVLTMETSHVFSPDLDEGPVLETPDDPAPAPHRMEGIFIMQGPGICKGLALGGLHLTDIAPTVLYLLNTPVPEDMDGGIITEAFTADYLASHPPGRTGAGRKALRKAPDEVFTPEDWQAMEQTLKDLGYME